MAQVPTGSADEPREPQVPDALSHRTLNDIDTAIRSLAQGVVGDEFDLHELKSLLNES
jgi:hypothetical protein